MRQALAKHLGIPIVFVTGVLAAIHGVVLIVLLRLLTLASLEAAGGFVLVAWVIFHPARVPDDARSARGT
jgi:hypothetical protein